MIRNFLRKNWFSIAGILILCGISFGAGWWVNEGSAGTPEKIMDAAYREIAAQSIDNTQSNQELSYAAIRGMLASIHDPYAELIESEAAQNFANTFSGNTGLVGLYTKNHNNQVVIGIVFPNGSAEKAGIKVGDILLNIDGKDLDAQANSSEVGLLLRGDPGTRAHLKVEHEGQIREYDLLRKEQEFVTARMLPEGIGYISLSAFNQKASEQMRKAVGNLLQEKPAALIWDLRDNEGGDMQAAQSMLSLFIKDGLLFSAKLTNNRTVEFRATGGATAAEIPIAVLIDKTTYSAAETCAAAIAETGRGTVIGNTSFGKGVVQATIPIHSEIMLQMTVAKWLSPNGEWYQGRGVPPGIERTDDPATEKDEILDEAVRLLTAK